MTIAALILALIATPLTDSAGADDSPIASASRGEPVLLDFHTEWCGPCKMMRPGLAQLASAGYPIRSIDADREKELAARYKVTAYPTFIVVDDSGKQIARTEGYQPAADLAALYREAQSRVHARPKARQVAERKPEPDDRPGPNDVDAADAGADEPASRKFTNPQPWETVVRIRVRLGGGSEGVGSGTVIYADSKQAIILTCAHIFKEHGRTPPPPSRFNLPISVDLFDGQRGGPKKNQVHYVETFKGEAIDYDATNDVGLILIRPGRVLPATRVVPPQWKPGEGMHMFAVGCSEGHDATAWDTRITRPMQGLVAKGTEKTFYMIECDKAPKEGRSGGGLYTDDYYLAGVCDFADPQHDRGLYAVPESIYKLLDRNKLAALYDPAARANPGDSRRLLADGSTPKRPSSEGTYRGQSPIEGELTIPPPSMLGIKPPVLAENKASRRREAVPAGMSREGDVDQSPAPEAAPEERDERPAPPIATGKSKWKPVGRSVERN